MGTTLKRSVRTDIPQNYSIVKPTPMWGIDVTSHLHLALYTLACGHFMPLTPAPRINSYMYISPTSPHYTRSLSHNG